MVELVEVEDESFEKSAGSFETQAEEEDYTDTDSSISTDDEDDDGAPDETFLDRIVALRDIVPPTTRAYIASTVSTTSDWVARGLSLGGSTLWVVGTSALFVAVPWAMAFAEEQQILDMEKEMKMREAGNELLTPSQSAASALNAQLGGAQDGKPAL